METKKLKLNLSIQYKVQKIFKLKRVFFLSFLIFELMGTSSCNPLHSNLEKLGNQSNSNYNDVSIPENFVYDFEKTETQTNKSKSSSNQTHQSSQSVSQQSLEKNESYNTSFKVENAVFQLPHSRALRWNGCYREQETRGGHGSNVQCGRAFLHNGFHSTLEEHFFKCVQSAATRAGYPKPNHVFINHWGTYSNRTVRNGRRLSLHARARAIDIVYFNIFDERGKNYRISTFKRHYKGKQALFYDEFRDCWRDSLPRKCARTRGSEFIGSIGHKKSKLGGDSRHNDHLHLSLPLCAGT